MYGALRPKTSKSSNDKRNTNAAVSPQVIHMTRQQTRNQESKEKIQHLENLARACLEWEAQLKRFEIGMYLFVEPACRPKGLPGDAILQEMYERYVAIKGQDPLFGHSAEIVKTVLEMSRAMRLMPDSSHAVPLEC